jgi:hypothetical protein
MRGWRGRQKWRGGWRGLRPAGRLQWPSSCRRQVDTAREYLGVSWGLGVIELKDRRSWDVCKRVVGLVVTVVTRDGPQWWQAKMTGWRRKGWMWCRFHKVEWQNVLVEREWESVEGVEEIVQRKM